MQTHLILFQSHIFITLFFNWKHQRQQKLFQPFEARSNDPVKELLLPPNFRAFLLCKNHIP